MPAVGQYWVLAWDTLSGSLRIRQEPSGSTSLTLGNLREGGPRLRLA